MYELKTRAKFFEIGAPVLIFVQSVLEPGFSREKRILFEVQKPTIRGVVIKNKPPINLTST